MNLRYDNPGITPGGPVTPGGEPEVQQYVVSGTLVYEFTPGDLDEVTVDFDL